LPAYRGATVQIQKQPLVVLQSRQFAEQYIRDRNLLPFLFVNRWDAERKE
jgi:hypothetical protein